MNAKFSILTGQGNGGKSILYKMFYKYRHVMASFTTHQRILCIQFVSEKTNSFNESEINYLINKWIHKNIENVLHDH